MTPISIPSHLSRSCNVSFNKTIKPGKNIVVFSRLVNSVVSGKDDKTTGNKSNSNISNNINTSNIGSSIKMTKVPRESVQRCPSMFMTSIIRHGSPLSDVILDDDSTSSTSHTVASMITDTVEKSVHFNENCYVQKTISRHNYTPQEIEDCWFSDEEYYEIRSECIEKIEMLERGEELDSIDDCVRGLDSRTQSATIAKQNNRLARCSIGRPQRAICKRWSRKHRRRVL